MKTTNDNLWGPLTSRFETKQPRKILSLDGGGIRGVITLEILSKLEKDLKVKLGKGDDFRLSDYFDHFGGTSTGAIIAAGLSIGMSVDELLKFYEEKGKDMFIRGWMFWKYKYASGPLRKMLQKVFGENTNMDISNGHFKSLLTVVTMNRSTDSPWPITNNPKAKYNSKERKDNNQKIKLHQLVRASTAAPSYFPDEKVSWDKNDPSKTFIFVDGGVTPYNNPAFLLFKMSTLPHYKLEWDKGENNLLIVSVGTGSSPKKGSYGHLLNLAQRIPEDLMYSIQVDQDINCRTIGKCTFGAPIDRELYDMIYESQNKKHFTYVRYDVDLSDEGLDILGLGHIKSSKIRKMDKAKNISKLRSVGAAYAEKNVDIIHLGSFV